LNSSNPTAMPLLRSRQPSLEMVPEDLGSLVSLSVLEHIQEAFSTTLGIPLLFVSPTGNPITRTVGLEMFCSHMTRTIGAKRPCPKCKRTEGTIKGGLKPHKCPLGLLDVVMPIMAGDIVSGYLVTSQTTVEPGAPNALQAARKSGMSTATAISYVSRIPVHSALKMQAMTGSVGAIALLVSELATITRQKKISESRDPMTGLVNREHFWKLLEQEMHTSDIHNYPVTLLLVDIDGLSKINDTFGHEVGDQVMHIVGEIVGSEIRTSDLAARYCGDAFVVMLPCSDSTGSEVVAWRLKNKVSQYNFVANGQVVPLSISTSCVTHPTSAASDPDGMLKEAYSALHGSLPSVRKKAA
jgi:diguanylate cyclase (GGDEF)-like protein